MKTQFLASLIFIASITVISCNIAIAESRVHLGGNQIHVEDDENNVVLKKGKIIVDQGDSSVVLGKGRISVDGEDIIDSSGIHVRDDDGSVVNIDREGIKSGSSSIHVLKRQQVNEIDTEDEEDDELEDIQIRKGQLNVGDAVVMDSKGIHIHGSDGSEVEVNHGGIKVK